MSLATGTGSAAKRPVGAKPVTGLVKFAVPVVLLAVCAGAVFLYPSDPPNRIGPPDQGEAAATVAALTRATKAQGVCYGWRLNDDWAEQTPPLSVGSNAGADVSVRTARGCARWLEIVAYLSPSSRRNKVVLDLVDSRTNADDTGVVSARLRIGSVGVNEQVFLADTGAGILRAVRALPLIVAEDGIAAPVSAEPAPATAIRPLPAVGSDLWRGRSDLVKLALPLFGCAIVSWVMLVRAARRRRR